jgi:hypothetical protein
MRTMHTMMNRRSVSLAVMLAAVCAVPGTVVNTTAAAPQEPASQTRVAELIAALDKHGLRSLAAEDPSRPDHVVAVLYVPRVQLLTIAGRCAATEALRAHLDAAAYRDVYTDLHACAEAETRLFIQDMSADGLRPEPRQNGAPFDIVYQRMSHRTLFDGDFKSQQLTSEQYDERFRAIDAEYARLASILVDSVSTR